ncbi:hypothetical protein P261_00071 [Lachnospiraceae bacterium TWA4]|nr:hypothetical protein P261_00071 [Lachnospiraceae bacterium TWA4]
MLKHIIIWKLKETLTPEEKVKSKDIKVNLEALVGKVPGLTSVEVTIDLLDSSTGDLMLDTTMESEEALKGYAIHPEHVKVANTYVRPYTQVRMCVDYLI